MDMKHRIFVLEDNREIRELIEYLLASSGYDVQSFECAEDFYMGIGNSRHPDLIILDVMLPDGNGLSICEDLKANETTKTIPIMMMSANESRAGAKQAGAEDFIAKPFDISTFVNRVHKQIA
jgi:DNA-binding response OmpR family regulator